MRIPDRPTQFDLEVIGRAYRGSYDESKNGLLVLDECGDWFNARNWSDKSRQGLNTWFRHAGKLGWDVDLITQDISIIDSQARSALAASIARCKRMDKYSIPVVTQFCKWVLGLNVRPHKFHMARVEDQEGVLQDRWIYRGTHLYSAYDTAQIFKDDYPHGVYCMLSPWHYKGRHRVKMTPRNIMRITKIYWKRFSSPLAFATGSLASALLTFHVFVGFGNPETVTDQEEVPVTLSAALSGAYISSYRHYPNSSPMYKILNQDGEEIDLNNLRQQGVYMIPENKCRLTMTMGEQRETVTCTNPV